jgi:actin related protein 2/3 complex subunit 1A/1B
VLDGKWNTEGDKFVVGCGSSAAAVGYYNVGTLSGAMRTDSLEMWNTQIIARLHDSSVISVAFEASGLVFATGSTDGSAKIVSSYLPEIDGAKSFSGPFAEVKTFGEVLHNIGPLGDWVNSVAWSPDSTWLGYTTHNSLVHFWS